MPATTFAVEKALIGSDDWVVKSVHAEKADAAGDVRSLRSYFRSRNYRLRVVEVLAS